MKSIRLMLLICLIFTTANGQSSTYADALSEKRFVTLFALSDPAPFMLKTTNGDLWKLDLQTAEWVYLGDPRGADSGRRGKFKIIPFAEKTVLILDTDTGEAWIVNAQQWIEIKRPSTRKALYRSGPGNWGPMWEEFKRSEKPDE